MRGLIFILMAMTVGCVHSSAPEPTYLGDFWIKWYGSTAYRATRIDRGDGIYEDAYRQDRSWPDDGECAVKKFNDTDETSYRGLVLISEWTRFHAYDYCNGLQYINNVILEYDTGALRPRDIYDTIVAGDSIKVPYMLTEIVRGYACAIDVEVCDRDSAVEILRETEDKTYFHGDGIVRGGAAWYPRGEGVVELADGPVPVLVFDSKSVMRRWYDPAREVVVAVQILGMRDSPLKDRVFQFRQASDYDKASQRQPGQPSLLQAAKRLYGLPSHPNREKPARP